MKCVQFIIEFGQMPTDTEAITVWFKKIPFKIYNRTFCSQSNFSDPPCVCNILCK